MSHTIILQPGGQRFVAEEGETLLDAALRQGLSLPFGCRGGACGACKGSLLTGRIDYGGKQALGLSDGERQRGQILLCLARPLSDLSLEIKRLGAAADIEVKTLPCRVARMERLAEDVMRLFLKLPQQADFRFLAGQYIDILLRDGRRRSFSLANAPASDALLELHIRRVEGGRFTSQVFAHMQEKDLLRFEGPLGEFFLRQDSDRPVILVAGGTGFAPIKSMLEQAFAEGTQRPFHLYWGARTVEGLYLDQLPRQWAATRSGFHYTPVLSAAAPGSHTDYRQGQVHEAVCQDFGDLSGFDVYASGPPAMVEAARSAFLARGLDADHFHADAFVISGD